jgi:hypothetical protein
MKKTLKFSNLIPMVESQFRTDSVAGTDRPEPKIAQEIR